MEIIVAWVGVILTIIIGLAVIIAGSYCAVRYIQAAIKYKAFIPSEEREIIVVPGLLFLVCLILGAGPLFGFWCFETIFIG